MNEEPAIPSPEDENPLEPMESASVSAAVATEALEDAAAPGDASVESAESADSHEEPAPAAAEDAPPEESGVVEATGSSTDEAPAAPAEPAVPAPPASNKRWYVVKVQSGREDSIKGALERRIKIDNLEEYVGRILIPTEKVTELRNGKRVVKKKKKFPGYLMCEVEFNDKILYLFRETSGVGDFVGATQQKGSALPKPPLPMSDREVERMLQDTDEARDKKPGGAEEPTKKKIIIPYAVKDRVKVRDGTFKDMEGEVKEITEPADPKENPKVKVELSIWGRPVDVEVEYWQVDPV